MYDDSLIGCLCGKYAKKWKEPVTDTFIIAIFVDVHIMLYICNHVVCIFIFIYVLYIYTYIYICIKFFLVVVLPLFASWLDSAPLGLSCTCLFVCSKSNPRVLEGRQL